MASIAFKFAFGRQLFIIQTESKVELYLNRFGHLNQFYKSKYAASIFDGPKLVKCYLNSLTMGREVSLAEFLHLLHS